MQRRNAPRDGSSGFADRINDLEKQFEKLDPRETRTLRALNPKLKEGESSHIIRGERPPAYLWIPGGGVLVLHL